jgi:hypothetical protein
VIHHCSNFVSNKNLFNLKKIKGLNIFLFSINILNFVFSSHKKVQQVLVLKYFLSWLAVVKAAHSPTFPTIKKWSNSYDSFSTILHGFNLNRSFMIRRSKTITVLMAETCIICFGQEHSKRRVKSQDKRWLTLIINCLCRSHEDILLQAIYLS